MEHGQAVESYPDDTPYPSRLLLAFVETRPIHVVFAYNEQSDENIVITVYEPDPALWNDDFMERRKP